MKTLPSPIADTPTALKSLGITETTLTQDEKDFLDSNGYLPLANAITPQQLETIRARMAELEAQEKENAGKEFEQEAGTTRLANLVDKGEVFRLFFTHPRVVAGIAHVLQGEIKLSSLNSRAALPGQGLQGLHADWHSAVEPGNYQVCNSIWLLDDFTTENGATRVVPKSHRSGKMPSQEMKDPSAPHPEQKILTAPAGTVVVFNSHTWHGGTLNRTNAPRRALHSYWTRRNQPQQQDQRKMLSPETKAAFTPAQRYLLDVED